MTYTVTWYRFPNGIEGEAMDSKSRDFDNLEKAVAFARRRAEIIRGIYWAGAFVEDENGNEILNITDGYSEYWHKSANRAKDSDYDERGMVKNPDEIPAPSPEWTPIIITDEATGRKVHCTIFDSTLYKAGIFTFDNLWDIYGGDTIVQIMNGLYKAKDEDAA